MDDDAELLNKLGALAGSTANIQPRPALSDAIMAAVLEEVGDPLARISVATADMEPDDRISDAVMAVVDPANAPALSFGDIARVTAGLRPADNFTDAVMAALPNVRSARGGLSAGIIRSGRASLLVAGFVAAASIFLSWYTERSVDEQTVASIIAEDGE